MPTPSAAAPPSRRDRCARAADVIGLTRIIEELPRRTGLLIINYHRLFETFGSQFDDGVFSASAEMFERHVRHMKRNFEVLSLAEAVDVALGKTSCRGQAALLTFDDGYIDCYTLAFPVLRAHGVPASFFVVTSIVGSDAIMWWDQIAYAIKTTAAPRLRMTYPAPQDVALNDETRAGVIDRLLAIYKSADTEPHQFITELFDACQVWPHRAPQRMFMNWDEITEMHQGGMDFGSHTHTHPLLGKLPLPRQIEELRLSRDILETRLGTRIDTLAYPVGSREAFNPDTKRALERCGYRAAFSFYGGTNEPSKALPFDLRRVSAEAEISWPRFRLQCALAPHLQGYWF